MPCPAPNPDVAVICKASFVASSRFYLLANPYYTAYDKTLNALVPAATAILVPTVIAVSLTLFKVLANAFTPILFLSIININKKIVFLPLK
jgi:hypothetical protein